MHGDITWILPVWLPLFQTCKNVLFFSYLLSFLFYKIGKQEVGQALGEGVDFSGWLIHVVHD
jgi:hypothetical protein